MRARYISTSCSAVSRPVCNALCMLATVASTRVKRAEPTPPGAATGRATVRVTSASSAANATMVRFTEGPPMLKAGTGAISSRRRTGGSYICAVELVTKVRALQRTSSGSLPAIAPVRRCRDRATHRAARSARDRPFPPARACPASRARCRAGRSPPHRVAGARECRRRHCRGRSGRSPWRACAGAPSRRRAASRSAQCLRRTPW